MDWGLPFFGLDGTTGNYLLSVQSQDVAALALSDALAAPHLDDLRQRLERNRPGLGVVDAVEDVTDLAQTGWGVIFAAGLPGEVKAALKCLLDLRREQATGRQATHYREYQYVPGETKQDFTRRLGVPGSGAADPRYMPYYLLLVGDPQAIPFSFQYQLDVQYAVGRIHFDTPDEYQSYARSVVAAETGTFDPPRRVVLFGVQNPDDVPTSLSASGLVAPLAATLNTTQADAPTETRWTIECIIGEGAGKARLRNLLGGTDTPRLLFTASHGVGFADGDPRQREHQGALVCQDWPGPNQSRGGLSPDYYLSADDISEQADLRHLIAFHFACFGAGTPMLDDYPQLARNRSSPAGPLGQQIAHSIAPHAFVARLPQRLLGHPLGGALAVVGHVERALGSSFVGPANGGSASGSAYGDALGRLMRGVPVGNALEPFNERYAELCADLASEIGGIQKEGKLPNAEELARLWTASADARSYIIIGDPAVRLARARWTSIVREAAETVQEPPQQIGAS